MSSAHQLTVAQASLRGSGAGASLHPLLLALGWPGGEHGRFNGKRRLTKVFMLQALVRQDSLARAVSEEPA